MEIRPVDPADARWEVAHPGYRVCFWDRRASAADEYEIDGDELDAALVLDWARERARASGTAYTAYAVVRRADGHGLVRLAGAVGDPFAD